MEAMRRDEVIEKLQAHADEIRRFGVKVLICMVRPPGMKRRMPPTSICSPM
jgi:hypothetical protein